MAVIHGELDSFNQLQNHFKSAGINFLPSIDRIMFFKKHYEVKTTEKEIRVRDKAKDDLNLEIEKEKTEILTLEKLCNEKLEEIEKLLIVEKTQLQQEIDEISSKSNSIFSKVKIYFLKNKENTIVNNFKKEKEKLANQYKSEIDNKNNNLEHIANNYDLLVGKKVDRELFSLKRAKKILDESYDLFLGAIGEQKALDALKELPDTFTIINDFKLRLNKPIYNKSTDERIYSIQADHIVVGYSGVFLIETKNWSKDSINNSNLYSPIEQVKRSSFGLFCYLNSSNNSFLHSNWGKRKIPIKNIVLMTGAKPKGDFKHVKILGLNEVCSYIKYFKPIFNQQDVGKILESLKDVSYSYIPKVRRYKSLPNYYKPIVSNRDIRRVKKIIRWLR